MGRGTCVRWLPFGPWCHIVLLSFQVPWTIEHRIVTEYHSNGVFNKSVTAAIHSAAWGINITIGLLKIRTDYCTGQKWQSGILLEKLPSMDHTFLKTINRNSVAVNSKRYIELINNFFVTEPRWKHVPIRCVCFQQDGVTVHIAKALVDVLRHLFSDYLISRFAGIH